MKMRTLIAHALVLMLCSFSSQVSAQEHLLVAGSGWNKVAIIDKVTAEIKWEFPLEKGMECNCARQDDKGNILFAYKKGARLITKDKSTIWNFAAGTNEEVQSVTPQKNGNYFIAICGLPPRFVTLNYKGEIVKEQKFDLQIERPHGQFRQVTPLSNGNIIIPVLGKGKVIEINKKGKILREVKVGGNPFSVNILPDKNWLVSCGDAHKYVLVDPNKGEIVKTLTSEDLDNHDLNFVAEIEVLENGNYWVANWNGHAKDKTQPKILEINKDNKVVWSLPHNDQIKNISSVSLIRR